MKFINISNTDDHNCDRILNARGQLNWFYFFIFKINVFQYRNPPVNNFRWDSNFVKSACIRHALTCVQHCNRIYEWTHLHKNRTKIFNKTIKFNWIQFILLLKIAFVRFDHSLKLKAKKKKKRKKITILIPQLKLCRSFCR